METGRRDDILREAATLVATRGYRGVSMRDIAGAVGMTAGSLYHHFPSKEALFIDIHAAAIAGFEQALDDALAPEAAPWDRLSRAAEAHLTQLLALGAQVAIVSPDTPGLSPGTAATLRAARKQYEDRFRALIDDLPVAGDVDRSLLRLMLLGALNWAPVWRGLFC